MTSDSDSELFHAFFVDKINPPLTDIVTLATALGTSVPPGNTKRAASLLHLFFFPVFHSVISCCGSSLLQPSLQTQQEEFSEIKPYWGKMETGSLEEKIHGVRGGGGRQGN